MFILHQLQNKELILGSQSPRRKELLKSAGFKFITRTIPTSEEYPHNLKPHEVAEYLSRQKAEPFRQVLHKDHILITADTIVVKENEILNKAADETSAGAMLRKLSNTSHRVITGVCITSLQKQVCFHETTHVTFSRLTDSEIHYYIEQFRPFDKAGAYGIQEWIGMIGVQRIEGCFYNVVGLPVPRLYQELKAFIEL